MRRREVEGGACEGKGGWRYASRLALKVAVAALEDCESGQRREVTELGCWGSREVVVNFGGVDAASSQRSIKCLFKMFSSLQIEFTAWPPTPTVLGHVGTYL